MLTGQSTILLTGENMMIRVKANSLALWYIPTIFSPRTAARTSFRLQLAVSISRRAVAIRDKPFAGRYILEASPAFASTKSVYTPSPCVVLDERGLLRRPIECRRDVSVFADHALAETIELAEDALYFFSG
jgi:hypothetical protein